MGIYLNPQNETKEEWLEKYGTRCTPDKHRDGDNVVVCLVDNHAFTAAGVCYSQRELEAFAHPCGRRKKWFSVPIARLVEEGTIEAEDIEA